MQVEAHLSLSEATRTFQLAQEKAIAGKIPEAERLLSMIQRGYGDYFPALIFGAQLREALGDARRAVLLYEAASRSNPGHAYPFTRRAILLARQRLGPNRPPKKRNPTRPLVTMTSLGANGRFGNQLLQYGILRLYADKVDADVSTPDWIGRYIYGFDDALCDSSFKGGQTVAEAEAMSVISGVKVDGARNANLHGYFCSATEPWSGYKERFRSIFSLTGKAALLVDQAVGRLRERAATIVAIHVRHGDFGTGRFWVAPCTWYIKWLEDIWSSLERPLLYIASDDPDCVAAFREYAPYSSKDLGPPIPGVEFLYDHAVMRTADYLATSNSTFSVTAALLNASAKAFLRPSQMRRALVPFAPWNSFILTEPEF